MVCLLSLTAGELKLTAFYRQHPLCNYILYKNKCNPDTQRQRKRDKEENYMKYRKINLLKSRSEILNKAGHSSEVHHTPGLAVAYHSDLKKIGKMRYF